MRKEDNAKQLLQKGGSRSAFSGKLGYVLAVAGSAGISGGFLILRRNMAAAFFF